MMETLGFKHYTHGLASFKLPNNKYFRDRLSRRTIRREEDELLI